MGDTCCTPFSLGVFKDFVEKQIPGVYINSLMIGNSVVEDMENGFFMYANSQVDYACAKVAEDPKLRNGFNAIGFSQGSQFLRALVQRCGHKLGPIRNLITLGGQHQGVYGLPHCGAYQHATCDYVRRLLNYAAYYGWVQKSLVQATYWHDPLDEVTYKRYSEFIADINNEREVNVTYVTNLKSIDHFVMVKFDNDSMVQPRETEWFGFYAPGQATKVLGLRDTELYIKDRLGLKAMDKAGKLVFLSQPGDHLRFDRQWFIDVILKPYLLN
ncbi:palmitoyl-protein thioesterase 1 isoform X2 [Aricia agestis]|nr:palmitoyl-protein thioesterase 1 isoform X2 [Aricia agestis]